MGNICRVLTLLILTIHTLIEEYNTSQTMSIHFVLVIKAMFKPTNKMSLLRRPLQEKHIEDGKIFFMDPDVLISYQVNIMVVKNPGK